MALRAHFFVHLADCAGRVDQKRRAIPVHRSLVLTLSNFQGIEQLRLRICEQLDGEVILSAEIFVSNVKLNTEL